MNGELGAPELRPLSHATATRITGAAVVPLREVDAPEWQALVDKGKAEGTCTPRT